MIRYPLPLDGEGQGGGVITFRQALVGAGVGRRWGRSTTSSKPGPMLIDARISRSVVTLPYRRIHYGEDA